MDEEVAAAKERGWREVAAIDEAYARSELDEAGWHAAIAAIVVPAYLSAETPEAGSGSSRDAAGWEYARSLIADAVSPGQTFLDVGCANGHLMESMADWAGIDPFGLDISPELVALARRRLPQWADRIWVGNAATWVPPRRFDVIRTGLDYVPADRRHELAEHLLRSCDRLIVGVNNEERDQPDFEGEARSWGYEIAGRSERPHSHPQLVYKVFWIDP